MCASWHTDSDLSPPPGHAPVCPAYHSSALHRRRHLRLRRKPEMNFCSTVICSLFRCSGKFFPVPLLSGTLISVPLFRAPKTGHRKNCVCFEKHPCFWAGKFAPAPKMSYLCTVNRATHIFVLMWSQLPPHEKEKNTRNHGNQSKSNRAQRVLHEG